MIAYIFPGQGSQFPKMGLDLYEKSEQAKNLFEQANQVLGYRLTDVMFNGSDEDLKQTRITQPAVFVHSVVLALTAQDFKPDMVAGHSLGEFSALVASKALSFESALKLVYERAMAMQKACELRPSTMAAILGLDDVVVEEICEGIDDIVVAANFNCPGQLVISGTVEGVNKACEQLKSAGAKRAMVLPVGGAFHSPLMEPAREQLAWAIEKTTFQKPICPIYQNVDAKPYSDPSKIKDNLIVQLTSPVRWTQIVKNMAKDGAKKFIECGPGNVLQGLVKKIEKDVEVTKLA
ncbi:MAG: ACP S-malonyltransferase [Flammeovirgaceae bacterium]